MNLKLRPYQSEVIEIIKENFKRNKRQYIEMPTGSGKTITFFSYIKKYPRKTLIIVPNKELLRQVYETALLFYDKEEISRKGDRHEEKPAYIHICIINSLRSKYLDFISKQNFERIIIDECHHSQSPSYKRLIDKINHEDLEILGVTATPDRLDGKALEELFERCTYKISIPQLINLKHLSDLEGFRIKSGLDISDIDSHKNDFTIAQLFKKLSNKSRNDLILKICKEELANRKTIIFCINVEHSIQICKILNESGLSCAHIDGKMNKDKRQSIIKGFKEGIFSFLTNCNLLIEGFDEPSIDAVLLARPTKSRSLFVQMIGRGLRIYPGKTNCKIIDIVDNHKNRIGFNSIISNLHFQEIEKFSSIEKLNSHIKNEIDLNMESKVQRISFFEESSYFQLLESTENQINYLKNNKILYFEPISFDEASFLMWHDKLIKEEKCL